MFSTNRTSTGIRLAAILVAGTMLAGAAPALAAQNPNAGGRIFASKLTAQAPSAKFRAVAAAAAPLATSAPMAAAPVKALAAGTTVKPASTKSSSVTKRAAAGSEQAQAKAILAGLIAKYPILQGTTVTFGDARGYQAIALYKSGRIIINPAHTTSLSRILNHEVWHVIDWRDNGSIDWGENIPPRQ